MGKVTQDEKEAIRDAGVKQWWKDWFTADYSWDGLTKYRWQGWKVIKSKTVYNKYIKTHGLPEGCPNKACQVVPEDFEDLPEGTETRYATLQDYWRDQEDKLEGHEVGKQYTIAHLPLKFDTGENSWKADALDKKHKVLLELFESRLGHSVKTEIKQTMFGEKIFGTDGRANFRGCVLTTLASSNSSSHKTPDKEKLTAVHITAYQAAFTEVQDFSDTKFGSGADFSYSLFSGESVKFERTEFLGGDARFFHSQFSGGKVSFHQALFSGGTANFQNAQFSGGDASFWATKFSDGGVYFNLAKFTGGHTSFYNSRFSQGTACFSNSTFSGGPVDFSHAIFSGEEANFYNSKFLHGDTRFYKVKFSGGAKFEKAQFSDGNANFFETLFSGKIANFYETKFSGGRANFIRAHFSTDEARFEDVKFEHSLDFGDSIFDKKANFYNAKYPPAAGSQGAFHGAQFLGQADFRTKFKEHAGGKLTTSHLYFPFNAFDHANFKDQLILSQRSDKEAQIEFGHALESIAKACKTEDELDKIEAHYVSLEAGCTTLKRAMENISDKNRAQRYFKFELLSRQKRPKTSRIVKILTRLYGWTADYGGSILRPLISLVFVWVFFAFVYGLNGALIDVPSDTPSKSVLGGLDFSATHIFRPLFVWSTVTPGTTLDFVDWSWLQQYKEQLGAGGWLSIKLLATFQSFISLTLLFLFSLAVKRKFQIR